MALWSPSFLGMWGENFSDEKYWNIIKHLLFGCFFNRTTDKIINNYS